MNPARVVTPSALHELSQDYKRALTIPEEHASKRLPLRQANSYVAAESTTVAHRIPRHADREAIRQDQGCPGYDSDCHRNISDPNKGPRNGTAYI